MSAAPMSFIPKPPANKTHGPCTVHPGVAMVQKWIEELPGKTGRSLEEWIALTYRYRRLRKKDRITRRIEVRSKADIDDELKKWLKKAYEMDE
jgi:hypothetical protein